MQLSPQDEKLLKTYIDPCVLISSTLSLFLPIFNLNLVLQYARLLRDGVIAFAQQDLSVLLVLASIHLCQGIHIRKLFNWVSRQFNDAHSRYTITIIFRPHMVLLAIGIIATMVVALFDGTRHVLVYAYGVLIGVDVLMLGGVLHCGLVWRRRVRQPIRYANPGADDAGRLDQNRAPNNRDDELIIVDEGETGAMVFSEVDMHLPPILPTDIFEDFDASSIPMMPVDNLGIDLDIDKILTHLRREGFDIPDGSYLATGVVMGTDENGSMTVLRVVAVERTTHEMLVLALNGMLDDIIFGDDDIIEVDPITCEDAPDHDHDN